MSYFREKVGALRLIWSALREWPSVIRFVYPAILSLVVYEWLMVHLIDAIALHWLRLTALVVLFFCYFLVFSFFIVSIYVRLIDKESSMKAAWKKMKDRLPVIAISQLVYFVLCFGVLAALVAIFKAPFMAHVANGFFRRPIVDILLVGGVFTVLLYTCYLFVPFVAMRDKPVVASFFDAVSLATVDGWGQSAALFIGLLVFAVLLSARSQTLMMLRAHELKWLYNAVVYSTLGVWLISWMVLHVDNTSEIHAEKEESPN